MVFKMSRGYPRAVNGGGQFGILQQNIYPKGLKLKGDHSESHANILHLDLAKWNGQIIYKSIDKRHDFAFFIFSMS